MTTKTTATTNTNVTVFLGHSAPTTPEDNEVVGFAYDMTVTYGNGKSYRYYRKTPVLGKTNDQLDLLAMVFALRALKKPATVTFVTDSRYILDTFAKLRKYVQAGWKTRTGSEVANKEGWQCIIDTAKKGGHHFAIVKADGLAAYQVSNCHLEAKKAVNLRLMAELQLKAKSEPSLEAKNTSSLSAKSEPAPKAAQLAEPQADNKEEQLAPDNDPFGIPEIPELPEEAAPELEPPKEEQQEMPFTNEELFMLGLQKKAKERFGE